MKYSENKIIKAMSMIFEKDRDIYYVKSSSDKDCYEYKIIIDKETKVPICGCWWYTNRSKGYSNKYGLCSHQLGYLFKFDKKKFWKEVSLDEK